MLMLFYRGAVSASLACGACTFARGVLSNITYTSDEVLATAVEFTFGFGADLCASGLNYGLQRMAMERNRTQPTANHVSTATSQETYSATFHSYSNYYRGRGGRSWSGRVEYAY